MLEQIAEEILVVRIELAELKAGDFMRRSFLSLKLASLINKFNRMSKES